MVFSQAPTLRAVPALQQTQVPELIPWQVREYVTTSLWGGVANIAGPRRISKFAMLNSAYQDTLWYFNGGRPLPVSLTIDDAPGDV